MLWMLQVEIIFISIIGPQMERSLERPQLVRLQVKLLL